MKIVINGGTGLIGSKTTSRLSSAGHEVVAGSPQTGLNSITCEGIQEAVNGAQVVIDLSNSPSFEDAAVMEFFRTSTSNLVAAARDAGVRHFIALSIVGTERLPSSGYFRAKNVQEDLIRASGLPYTIVHSTQFFEFLGAMAKSWEAGDKVVVPPAQIQPIAADDVANVMAEVALAEPRNGVLEISGPERFQIRDVIADYLAASDDPRTVVTSRDARYFGAELQDGSLVSNGRPRVGQIDFSRWFTARAAAA